MFDFRNADDFKNVCGYEINGLWYPRVTKIVEIKAKPALYRFYAEMKSYDQGRAVTRQSASEGTLIHNTFEKILLGEKPSIDPTIAPAIRGAVDFLEKNRIEVDPEFIERRVVNPEHRYAGTIDTLALIGGRFGILDIKTSKAIYRDYNLQTAAYIEALKNQIPNLQTRWIMRIDQLCLCRLCDATLRSKGGRDKISNGRCPLDKHQWSELQGVVELEEFPYWQDDFQGFLGAKKLWEWENNYWLREINYF